LKLFRQSGNHPNAIPLDPAIFESINSTKTISNRKLLRDDTPCYDVTCPNADCQMELYDLNILKSNNLQIILPEVEDKRLSNKTRNQAERNSLIKQFKSILQIYIPTKPDTFLIHNPKLEPIEFLSYIGGCVSM